MQNKKSNKAMLGLKMRTHHHVATLIKNKRNLHPERYSQNEISSLLGLKCNKLISGIEEAKRHVPFKVMPKISKILDIDPGEFMEAALKDHEESLDHYFNNNFEKKIIYM